MAGYLYCALLASPSSHHSQSMGGGYHAKDDWLVVSNRSRHEYLDMILKCEWRDVVVCLVHAPPEVLAWLLASARSATPGKAAARRPSERQREPWTA